MNCGINLNHRDHVTTTMFHCHGSLLLFCLLCSSKQVKLYSNFGKGLNLPTNGTLRSLERVWSWTFLTLFDHLLEHEDSTYELTNSVHVRVILRWLGYKMGLKTHNNLPMVGLGFQNPTYNPRGYLCKYPHA